MPKVVRYRPKRHITINPYAAAKGLWQGGKMLHAGYKRARAAYNGPAAASATTVQRDLKTTRRGKKTPKRVLRRKTKFRNKIVAALAPNATHHTYTEIQLATYTQTKNTGNNPVQEQYLIEVDTALGAPSTVQATLTLNAGGNNVNGIKYLAEQFHNLAAQTVGGLNTGTTAQTGANSRDLKVLKSSMDVALTNPSTIALVYDVYWCVATMTQDKALYGLPQLAWKQLLVENQTLTVSGAQKTVQTDNGTTPNSAPGFGKYWKVLTKHRVYLQPGATSEFTFEGGAYMYRGGKWDGQQNISGITKALMIVAGIGDNTGLINTNPVMRTHTTRRYRVMYPYGKDKIPNLPVNTTRIVN